MKKLVLSVYLISCCFMAFTQTQYNATTYAQFNTNYGYIQLGPMGTGYAHIYTDRPVFAFNKTVLSINGDFGSYYTSDLIFKTGVSYYSNFIGDTRMTILNSNGNVGIGTTSPTEKLEVSGNIKATKFIGDGSGLTGITGTSQWTSNGSNIFYNTGKVGIGGSGFDTQNDYKLEVFGMAKVNGQFVVKGNSTGDMVDFNNLEPDIPATSDLIFGSYGWVVSQVNNPSLIRLNGIGGATRFVVRNNGQVGIGIDPGNCSSLLTVNGKITAAEIEVKQDVLADFVFKPGYNLKSLSEIEKYIKVNKHLPEIPSADEVKQSGLNIGDMQNKLLQKVEELTLYIIEQENRIKLLESQINSNPKNQ